MSLARSLFLAAALSAAFAGSALARDAVFTAKLQTPVASPTRVIAQNTLWSCDGDTCLARPSHGVNVRACRQFAHEVGGPVIAYGSEGAELNADELSRCNAEFATLQAQN